jgi:hypothetical protein
MIYTSSISDPSLSKADVLACTPARRVHDVPSHWTACLPYTLAHFHSSIYTLLYIIDTNRKRNTSKKKIKGTREEKRI